MATTPLPTVPLGTHRVSRLVAGANTINGGSHLSRFVNQQMRRYFTPERVQDHLSACEAAGINTWQSGPGDLARYTRHRQNGGGLQFISLAAEDAGSPDVVQQVAAAGAIAIAHHGERTDTYFKERRLGDVREFLKKVRDSGLAVGVSTHMPAVVDTIESEGWDVDFYMTCVYERHRTREELKALLGYVPLPRREVYLEEDPPRMYKAIRETEKTCLAFKILAAGRLCDSQETVEAAFRETFANIKATDAVIVGMYPEYEDQIALNAEYTRQFAGI